MTYEDNRDWVLYNDRLVRRGWFYLHTDFLKQWDEELRAMNKGKNGRPYIYPNTFIQFCGLMYAFLHLPYRQLEGYLQALSGFIPGLRSANYTTLWQRIVELKLNVPMPENDIVVAVDSTGIKVTNRGDWIREKHNVKRRGWIKIHLAVDVETKKPVAFEITDERVSDHKMVTPLLKNVKMKDTLMDAGYDKEEVYKFLEEKGIIRPGINPRKDAIVNPKTIRSDSILGHDKFGHESWKNLHKYGMRWATEGMFSAIKRIFGETVRATSIYGMFQEVKRWIAFYAIIISI
jgi:hypothetical protein